jgi:hypothetical protein
MLDNFTDSVFVEFYSNADIAEEYSCSSSSVGYPLTEVLNQALVQSELSSVKFTISYFLSSGAADVQTVMHE